MSRGPIRFVDIRPPVEAENLPQRNARLGWRTPLSARELETIACWARAYGGASIRLHGEAVAQLDAVLQIVPVTELNVDGTRIVRPPRRAEHVLEVTLAGLPDRAYRTIAAFTGVHTLRVDARGADVDVRALHSLPVLRALSIASASLRGCAAIDRIRTLAALELVRTRVDELDPLLQLDALVALRLSKVDRVASLEALRGHPNVKLLALESLLYLESLAPIATLPRLQTLALAALWQFNVVDAAFIAEMRCLRALALDIGGTRKNVEITKRLGLPLPPAFDVGDYCFMTSYESGVQSLPAYLSSVTTVGSAGGSAAGNGAELVSAKARERPSKRLERTLEN